MTPEQEQYACDLINRSAERMDAGQQKCKVGKPCNGRCIPQNSKCGGEHPDHPGIDPPNAGAGYYNRTKKAKVIIKGVMGAAVLAGGVGVLAMARAKSKQKAKDEPFSDKHAKEMEEALKKGNTSPSPYANPSVKIMTENRAKRVKKELES